nr:hypothetical protein [uncultured Oscillibacter sp.]
MTNQEFVLDTLRRAGRTAAEALQARVPEMTGTELYAEEDYLPAFDPSKQYLGYKAGHVCRSPAGRVVKLIQPYDNIVYPQEPEELPAQWGFYWSTDPAKALPFIALSTSPYMTGDCCTHGGHVWRSGQDNNVWSPGTTGAPAL